VAEIRKTTQGYLPKSMYYFANRYLKGVKSWIQSYLAGSDIDWSGTRAFARGKEGEIYINLNGRDPHGIVEPGAEYESVRNKIIERLSQLKDPTTGEAAVDRVYRREELYRGPLLEWAPDLIVAWRDGKYMPTESDRDKDAVFVSRWREYMNWPTTGSHRIDGILFAKGPGIRRGRRIEAARIIDLMPTWLSALNREIPADIEGKTIPELFEPNHTEPGARGSSD
jgi:predicted AlkP superfamily phosphohydrolase/phosphomutase